MRSPKKRTTSSYKITGSPREIEERLRLFEEMSADAIYTICEGKFVSVNPTAVGLFGAKSPKELVGKQAFDFFHKDYHALIRERIKKNADGERLPYADMKIVRLDGTVADVQGILTPWVYQGKPAVQVVARDMSDHKRVEGELLQKKDFIERLIESSMDGIIAFDRDLRYTLRNSAIEKIIGIPNKELIGKRISEVYPNIKETGGDRPLREALQGKTVFIKDKPYTIPQTGKSGYYEAHFGPIYDEKNAVIGGLVIFRDVTERKKLEAAAEEKNIALREILKQIEAEKKNFEEAVAASVEKRILPIVRELHRKSKAEQKELVQFLEKSLEELTKSFSAGAIKKMTNLSRKEIIICEMIRKGMLNKDIAKTLKISPLTVGTHRNRIRKKLGLSHEDNLSTALL